VADYKAMVSAFAALPSKPRIYICRPVPLIPGRDDARMTNLREDILPMIAQVGKAMDVPIVDLYRALDGKPELFPDKIHPNAAGATIMAKTIHTAVTGNLPPK
jgi:lysophospholipase L1-like esterase